MVYVLNNEYLDYIEDYARKVDFKKIAENPFYFEKVYRDIGMKFEDLYGASYNEMDEAYIPGTLLNADNEKFIAVFFIGVRNGGINYRAIIFHPKYGLVDEDDFQDVLSEEEYLSMIHYKYRLCVKLLNDSPGNMFKKY